MTHDLPDDLPEAFRETLAYQWGPPLHDWDATPQAWSTDDGYAWELEALKRWNPPKLPPLSDQDRARLNEMFDKRVDTSAGRRDAHREHIRKTALYLGREVAAHRVTVDDADRRLQRLIDLPDPETLVAVVLVARHEAEAIARDAFRAGYTAKQVS
jgi:hypothetical protein